MKVTITIDCPDDSARAVSEVLEHAKRTVLGGDTEGTYGVGKSGEYTIAYWPAESEECRHCCGNGYVLQDDFIIVDKPLTPQEIQKHFPDGQIRVAVLLTFGEIACSSEDHTYDGLNDIMDEHILGFGGGSLMNLTFKPVRVEGDFVLVLVKADASELLDSLEQDRRDEKNGLYAEHEDPAN